MNDRWLLARIAAPSAGTFSRPTIHGRKIAFEERPDHDVLHQPVEHRATRLPLACSRRADGREIGGADRRRRRCTSSAIANSAIGRSPYPRQGGLSTRSRTGSSSSSPSCGDAAAEDEELRDRARPGSRRRPRRASRRARRSASSAPGSPASDERDDGRSADRCPSRRAASASACADAAGVRDLVRLALQGATRAVLLEASVLPAAARQPVAA